MKKICVITGTRAEYGLLRYLIKYIHDDADLELQVIATGMHLSPEFGLTYKEIEQDGFKIDRKVEMLASSDTAVGITKSMGLGLIGFADAIRDLSPDLIIVLGDRFEIHTAVISAFWARIPIVHLHGGELTEGALDESTRHAITKMAQVHCVSTEQYRQRVIQLGEQPHRVHCVGGLGVDAINYTKLLDRTELETSLVFKLKSHNLLITFHPATLESVSADVQMQELLAALDDLNDIGLIFTYPNADAGGRELINLVDTFVDVHPNARAFHSLGQLRYLSCMAHCDGIVGNSSSGILESPTLKKGAINIGNRQRGRLQAANVINCRATRCEIRKALDKLFNPDFQDSLSKVISPYGEGGASFRILEIIKTLNHRGLTQKYFYDLPSLADQVTGVHR